MMGIYWDLFFVFFKIGLFSFGGGLAMVSVIQQEVLAHGWIPAAEYARIITISQMTPGADCRQHCNLCWSARVRSGFCTGVYGVVYRHARRITAFVYYRLFCCPLAGKIQPVAPC